MVIKIWKLGCLYFQELKDENGRVYKLLSEKDFELRNMRKKQEESRAGQ